MAHFLNPRGLPATITDAMLTTGDAAEDAMALRKLRNNLATRYQPQGPEEKMLLDRIVALHWRLGRIQRAERGAITARTIGARAQHGMRVRDEAGQERMYAGLTNKPLLLSRNHITLAGAQARVEELEGDIEARMPVERRDLYAVVAPIFEATQENPIPGGLGAMILFAHDIWMRHPTLLEGKTAEEAAEA